MDFFRWKRTFLRALGPALLCGILAGWGVYVLTADERPTYRSQALLNTGIMTGRDGSGSYVRDLVLNELENIMNLAKSFETREELSVLLLAKLIAIDAPDPNIISPRAYDDFYAELDSSLLAQYKRIGSEKLIFEAIITDRDSLKRYGEQTAEHPLIELLYGKDPLVGMESLSGLRVNRKGMSDLLEISYSTVDAAWCKLTLDEHIKVFLAQHKLVEEQRSGGALAYFKEATAKSRAELNKFENKLRDFSTENKIINYYEQTRFIASLKNQVDNRYTEERMKQAASDSTLQVLEGKLAKRMDLVRLNGVVDDRRRELGKLSREQARIEIMTADSSETAEQDMKVLEARMQSIREELSRDIGDLQGVYNGPEGLELGRLISEWLATSIEVEEAKGKIDVLNKRKVEFSTLYTNMASLGATMKKIEREVHIAEEDYLSNLANLNEALQKEHSQRSVTDLRLVDQPILPTKPEGSKRVVMILAAMIVGGMFPLILAIALELLSGAILSFTEGERRSDLLVIGGVARWSTVRKILKKKSESAMRATTADLLWQGLRSRGNAGDITTKPHVVVFSSFRPGAGKSHVMDLLAKRLAGRGMQICVVSNKSKVKEHFSGITAVTVDSIKAMSGEADSRVLTGLSIDQWNAMDVVLWELPAMATGRLPVEVARAAHDALLVHPASAGWTSAHEGSIAQLKDTLGRKPQMVLNGLSADVLLNEWGTTWAQIRSWSEEEESINTVNPNAYVAPVYEEDLKNEEDDNKASTVPSKVVIPQQKEIASVAPIERLDTEAVSAAPASPAPPLVEVKKYSSPLFELPEQPTTPAPFPPKMKIEEDSVVAKKFKPDILKADGALDEWEKFLAQEQSAPTPQPEKPIQDRVPVDTDWENNLLF